MKELTIDPVTRQTLVTIIGDQEAMEAIRVLAGKGYATIAVARVLILQCAGVLGQDEAAAKG